MARVLERRGSVSDVGASATWERQQLPQRGSSIYFCPNLRGSTVYVGAAPTWQWPHRGSGLCKSTLEHHLRGSRTYAGAASSKERH